MALGIAIIAALCAAAAMAATWRALLAAGSQTLSALWTLPLLLALHAMQLLLSSVAWRRLIACMPPGLWLALRLRTAREGINTLLPVAHVGGEIATARLLTRRGLAGGAAGASVVVDVTAEVLSQAIFLLLGLAALALLTGRGTAAGWIGIVAIAAAAGGGFLAAQRLGALHVVDRLVTALARRFSDDARPAGAEPAGLHDAAMAIYRSPGRVLAAVSVHLAAWLLGTLETWLLLFALGTHGGLAQALVIESLGMAARSAGFAIPGALAVQEGGFVLAAGAVGVAAVPALSLALVKRVREVVVGLVGLLIWQIEEKGK